MSKEIIFSELAVDFIKQMNDQNRISVEFIVGKNKSKTQIKGRALKRIWKNQIALTYYQESFIDIKIYDETVPQAKTLSKGKLQIKSLNTAGEKFQLSLVLQTGEQIGIIKGKYSLKNSKLDSVSQMQSPTNLQPLVPKAHEKAQLTERSENVPLEPLRKQTNVSHHSSDKSGRSKQTLHLPQIHSSHSNYGDNIFDKQSASTLQKSILVYSMPKGPRFINQAKYSGEPTYCLDTCFKPNPSKGAGFGYGRKRQFPQWMQRNMKDNPAPGAYLEAISSARSKGPTFGISHKYYQRVLIGKQLKKQSSNSRKLSPLRQNSN